MRFNAKNKSAERFNSKKVTSKDLRCPTLNFCEMFIFDVILYAQFLSA